MKPGPRLLGMLVLALALAAAAGLPAPARAQTTSPAGIVAFAGVDADQNAGLYLLDLATGRVGLVDLPVAADVSFAWHPEGDLLAFTTAEGSYGLLRSLRGCFDADALCSDIVEVIPPFMILDLAWTPDGEALLLRTEDEGMKLSPPRARPRDITDIDDLACEFGFAVSAEPYYLFCAAADAAGNVSTGVYEQQDSAFEPSYQIGTFPEITAFDVGPDGRSAVGTLEAAGDSGFYSPPGGPAARLANYQIHVYDLEFAPDGTFAIAGATSDSTGDGTLRDGDPAELFLFDTETTLLTQVPGFTEATALTWSPDGNQILVITEGNLVAIYTPDTDTIADVPVTLPAGLTLRAPAWNPAEAAASLPGFVTATPNPLAIVTATPRVVPTLPPTPTTAPTFTPLPTLTPYPTLTPFPTFTPFPSATPGSPIGTGCQYAYVGGGGLPVAIGDVAAVTPYGAAVRFRTGAALNAPMIRELSPGTRMTILSGPYCSQGYRWWEARLESDGRTGYLADSDPVGYWIETVETAPPPEQISFYADRYSITAGQCVTIGWDVEGIQEVYYQGVGVTGHETRIECPAATATFTLRVIRLDNTETIRQVTIVVTAP